MSKKIFETAFDTYTEEKVIGQGGSGTVYEVTTTDSASYALKLLSAESCSSIKLKRFKNELNFCSIHSHTNIIKVIEYGFYTAEKNKLPFFVMPFYPKTLRDFINSNPSGETILLYFFQILDGIEFAHSRKTCHRDLKPENILWNDKTSTMVIADFGIAHFEEDMLLTAVETRNAERLANFQYAAPEQREKGATVTPLADIYSLGMILNEMFTKNLPLGIGFKKIKDASPDYSFLDTLVDLMLNNKPQNRPININDLRMEITGRQRLFQSKKEEDRLRQQPHSELIIKDPIYNNPIHLTGIDFSVGYLIFSLNQPLNAEWKSIFYDVSNARRVKEMGKPWYTLDRETATFHILHDQNHQKIVDDFKIFIEKTNIRYKQMIDDQVAEQQQVAQDLKENLLRNEMDRQKVLATIKI